MMKSRILSLLFFVAISVVANAQIVKGDMDGDKALTMTDANAIVNAFVNDAPMLYVDGVDNSTLVGVWYKSKYERIRFDANGATDLKSETTYKYLPALKMILLYSEGSEFPEQILFVSEHSEDHITIVDKGTYYSEPPVIMVSQITLSANTMKLSVGDSSKLTVTISPYNADNKKVQWTSSDESVATVSSEGLVYGKAKGKAVVTATADDGSGVFDSCEVYVGGFSENGDAVDLGLSVMWANFNLGATNPEDFGDYYAWGETETSTNYDWSNYSLCNGTAYSFTKYCTDTKYGKMDNKTVLDSEDDVASVTWGGSWRMPTLKEQEELRDSCTWTWTTYHDVAGYEVKGKNGNSIFLPAAGYRYQKSVYFKDERAYYWNTSLHSENYYAYYLYFNLAYKNVTRYERCYGFSVRAVCPYPKE